MAQVRDVYAQCAGSVDEELARHQANHTSTGSATRIPAEAFTAANGSSPANGNGHAQVGTHANGNGHANGFCHPPSRTNGKPRSQPSARQLEYVQDLAGRLGMDAGQLEELCQRLFEKPLGEISAGEASGLIRALQEMREGWLGPEAIYRPEGE